MYQPSKWWLGLAFPAILWGAANVLTDTKVEQDLTTKALAAFSWAKPVVSGRDATISGIAPSEDSKAKALTAIDAIPGVRMVKSKGLEVLAEAKPYKWQAIRDGNKVTLTGYYPDGKTHQDILDSTKKTLPNAQIIDEMKLARGVPAGFAGAVAFGLGQLANLTSGTASLDDLKYSITGAAPTSAIYTSEIAKVKALPQGLTLGTAAISPPVQKPYSWSALREGNSVTLSGFVPSDAVRNKNIDAVKASIAGVSVTDKQVIAGGEPAGFENMASYGIAQLGKLLKGTASLDDKAYSLIGEAVSIPVSEASLAATKTLPVGFTLGKAIVTAPAPIIVAPPVVAPPPVVVAPPPPPPIAVVPEVKVKQADICRTEFTRELKDSSIYFDVNKDTIRQVSYAVLDRLIEIAKKCPDVNVEIGAHTDADGAAIYNQDLSERRAQAVLNYMKVRIDTTKYTSVGFGETKPIASNDTDEGKQKNRRVEFIVK